MTLALIGRSVEKVKRVVHDVTETTGNQALRTYVCDLSSQADIRRLASEIARDFSRVDVLINNAGLINPKRSLSVDGIESTFALNHLA